MKIYLIRHGETVENKKGISIGNLPGRLDTEGKTCIKKLAKKIALIDPEIILSSDLKRAVDTTNIINRYIQKEIIYLKGLRERKLGSWTGIKKAKFQDLWEKKKELDCLFKPGKTGESYFDVLRRVKKVLTCIKKLPYERVLVVSHGRFNKILLNYIQNKPVCDMIKQKNCCLNIIMCTNRLVSVSMINNKTVTATMPVDISCKKCIHKSKMSYEHEL